MSFDVTLFPSTIAPNKLPSGCVPLSKEEAEAFKSEFKKSLINDLASKGLLATPEKAGEKEEIKKEIIEIKEKKTEIDKKILTTMFYAIFNKDSLSPEQVDTLFNTYLSDGSLTVEVENRMVSIRINSMKPVIRYLFNNQHVQMCNFKSFKAKVLDIPTLAQFLKTSKVTAIGLNSGIPDNAKTSLAEAVAARKGTLKVFYAA